MTRVAFLGFVLWAAILSAQPRSGVSYERIRDGGQDPQNWLTYSGDYRGNRYSAASEINAANVSALRPAWVHQVLDVSPALPRGTRLQVSPLVADGIMYLTIPRSGVVALDLRTGRQLWSYEHVLSPGLRLSAMANRGPALLDGTLFFGTLDAYLVALDAATGEFRWKTKVADHQVGYSITSAPLALKDKIVVGISGGEFGIRGFLDAYDPKTGERVWRFWTIPGPGERGNETWSGESWKTGGGPTWTTGSYDPEMNLILWGVGNPGPLFNGDVRQGDNLYTNSVVALDPDTGKLRWHFQFTPHDVLDMDSAQIPVLVDRMFRGERRKLVLFANRNGFFYVLDRETGRYLLGRPYGMQTWASGLDEKGRPILSPKGQPTVDGTLISPAPAGVTNWNSPSYSPLTGLLYVAIREDRATYFKQDKPRHTPGAVYPGGRTIDLPESEKRGAILALSPETGDIVWKTNLQSAPWGGLLATAGGVLFGGARDGWFFALDARNGKVLWHFNVGGEVRANPVSFVFDGRQHVTVAAGLNLFSFTLPD
jgi:alcohol dehydrogenase (cytochrome c)